MEKDIQELLDGLGRLFLELRHESGLSQRQAAKLGGTIQARVSYLENGKGDLMLSTIQRWARVYDHNVEIRLIPMEDDATREFNEALREAMSEIYILEE